MIMSAVPVCCSDKHFVNSNPDNHFILKNRKRKVFKILELLPYSKYKIGSTVAHWYDSRMRVLGSSLTSVTALCP